MNRFITFTIIFTFWLLWSGFYDPFHVILGIFSSILVVYWTGHLFVETKKSVGLRLIQWLRFESYSLWLLWQIVLANLQLFRLSFHPNLFRELSPKLITFKTTLSGDVPKFIFVQSITLTPGTVTVQIKGDEVKVHAINDKAAEGLPGEMEDRVKHIYKSKKYG